ncbi:hypothetical protein Z043_114826 [Scleropages formosus]|uniref:MARVEL domain-containing protein n=1 Tax=Scleropages formosus TaxID=113540 RepID=A0A0P7UY82_SCLFO|nr:hypothetical protein Z043_114826 [Scleropages formosus]
MAEFPAKVSTQTSSPAAQRAIGSGSKSIVLQYVSVDLHFLGSVPGILLLAEIVLGLLTWSLTASTSYTCVPAYGWVMFISITLWILTVTLFCILFLGIQQKLSFLPWQLMVSFCLLHHACMASANTGGHERMPNIHILALRHSQ